MALMILGINVNSIPARREHELKSDTVETVGIEIRLVWKEVAVERALRSNSIVEAVEAESRLTEEGLLSHVAGPVRFWEIRNGVTKVSLIGVTGDHLKAFGESRDSGVASIGVQEVVSGQKVSYRRIEGADVSWEAKERGDVDVKTD